MSAPTPINPPPPPRWTFVDPPKRNARAEWERHLQQKELDARLEMHRRLALGGNVVLREIV